MQIFLSAALCMSLSFCAQIIKKKWSGCRRASETSEEMPYSKRFKEFVMCSPTKEQWELT